MSMLLLPALIEAGLISGTIRSTAGTSSALAMLQLLSLTPIDEKCTISDCSSAIDGDMAAAHSLLHHTNLSISLDDYVSSIISCSDDIFCTGLSLHNC